MNWSEHSQCCSWSEEAASCRAFFLLRHTVGCQTWRAEPEDSSCSRRQMCPRRDVSTRHMTGSALCHRLAERAGWHQDACDSREGNYILHLKKKKKHVCNMFTLKHICIMYLPLIASAGVRTKCLFACGMLENLQLPELQKSLRIELKCCVSRRRRYIMSTLSARMVSRNTDNLWRNPYVSCWGGQTLCEAFRSYTDNECIVVHIMIKVLQLNLHG